MPEARRARSAGELEGLPAGLRRLRQGLGALGIVVALFAAGVPGALATEEPGSADREMPEVELDALPYAWIPGWYGSVAVEGTSVRIDVGPDDVLDLLFDGNAFAAAGYFALSYDRFDVFADSMGGYAEVSVAQSIPTRLCCRLTIDAKDEMKFVISDFGLGYRLGRWSLPGRRRPLTLGIYAGARHIYFANELDAKVGVGRGAERSANVYESVDWADPLIGVRWSAPLLDALSFDFRGDIGGFGAGSDLTWASSAPCASGFRGRRSPPRPTLRRATGWSRSTDRPAAAASTCRSGGRSSARVSSTERAAGQRTSTKAGRAGRPTRIRSE